MNKHIVKRHRIVSMIVNTLTSTHNLNEKEFILSLADQEQLAIRTAREYMAMAKHRIEMGEKDE